MKILGPIATGILIAIILIWIFSIEGCTQKGRTHKYEKKKMRYGI
jgi:uncharacterized lipoprotein YehR (DUF1307 family)